MSTLEEDYDVTTTFHGRANKTEEIPSRKNHSQQSKINSWVQMMAMWIILYKVVHSLLLSLASSTKASSRPAQPTQRRHPTLIIPMNAKGKVMTSAWRHHIQSNYPNSTICYKWHTLHVVLSSLRMQISRFSTGQQYTFRTKCVWLDNDMHFRSFDWNKFLIPRSIIISILTNSLGCL